MSHRIYTTLGFVVQSLPYGEAGKMLSLFTRELGMVNVAAAGIRLGQSKLRYHVQDFSLSEFSLVRGRDLWRLVGAEKSDMSTCHRDPLLIRTLAVLRRLIHGEEKNEALFEAVMAAYDFLEIRRTEKNEKAEEAKKAEEAVFVTHAEPVIMLRILRYLGYIRKKPELEVFLADNSFATELLEKMSVPTVKSLAVREINRALEESHL